MELIYTNRLMGLDPAKVWANGRFFTSCRSGVTRVFLDGNFPDIRLAYEAIGVPVERYEPEPIEEPPPVSAAGVDIPADWRDLPWTRAAEPGGLTMRGLVSQIGGKAVNRADAIEIIEAAIARGDD